MRVPPLWPVILRFGLAGGVLRVVLVLPFLRRVVSTSVVRILWRYDVGRRCPRARPSLAGCLDPVTSCVSLHLTAFGPSLTCRRLFLLPSRAAFFSLPGPSRCSGLLRRRWFPPYCPRPDLSEALPCCPGSPPVVGRALAAQLALVSVVCRSRAGGGDCSCRQDILPRSPCWAQ